MGPFSPGIQAEDPGLLVKAFDVAQAPLLTQGGYRLWSTGILVQA